VISRTTRSFWKLFDALPVDVQHQAERAYVLWRGNLGHRSLQFKCVSERHQVYSVRIGLHWRALGYRDRVSNEDVLTWFWIGSHADYDRLIAGY
jgi:hypothetical protein